MKQLLASLLCSAVVAGVCAQQVAAQSSMPRLTEAGRGMTVAPADTRHDALAVKRQLMRMSQTGSSVLGTPFSAPMSADSDVEPLTPPYTCSFDSEDDAEEWTVIDANDDGATWKIQVSSGYALCMFNFFGTPSDDYLVTARPIALKAGNNYVNIGYNGYGDGYYESFELLYGTSADVEQMTVLATYDDFTRTDEGFRVTENFDAPADGNYYFAIHATSKADQVGVVINDITIGEGTFVGVPDISVDKVTLPASANQLGNSETIGVTVANRGTAGIEKFTLVCTVNGTELARQTFDTALAPGASADLEFDTKADFSAKGKYTVAVTATDVVQEEGMGAEEVTDNNTAEASVTNFEPADVPYSVNFGNTNDREQWNGGSSWEYDSSDNAMACSGTETFVSRGLNLEAGKTYSLKYNYMAGAFSFALFDIFYEDYKIVCGPVSTDPSEGWSEIASFEDIYTDDAFTDEEVTFTVPADGVYSIGFVQDYPQGSFYLKTVSVTEICDYDVAVTSLTGLPSMLPAEQADGQTVNVGITNNGLQAASGTVTFSINGTEMGSATFTDLAAGAVTELPITLTGASLTSGMQSVSVTAELDGHDDQSPDNNTLPSFVEITGNMFAYDYVADGTHATSASVGSGSGEATVGVLFHFTKDVTLEAFSIGWGETEDREITLRLYPVDAETQPGAPDILVLGSQMYGETVEKGEGIGQMEYQLATPQQLSAGYYMLAMTYTGYGLVVDHVTPGQLYLVNDAGASGVTAVSQVSSSHGTPALRAVVSTTATSISTAESAAADGSLSVRVSGDVLTVTSAGEAITDVTLYAASGAAVSATAGSGSRCDVSLSGLTRGVYFAKVSTASGSEVKKFVIK